MSEKLTLQDLQFIFKQPRTDHPSRKSWQPSQPGLLPKAGKRTYGEFIPNPPGSRGVRNTYERRHFKEMSDWLQMPVQRMVKTGYTYAF